MLYSINAAQQETFQCLILSFLLWQACASVVQQLQPGLALPAASIPSSLALVADASIMRQPTRPIWPQLSPAHVESFVQAQQVEPTFECICADKHQRAVQPEKEGWRRRRQHRNQVIGSLLRKKTRGIWWIKRYGKTDLKVKFFCICIYGHVITAL